MLGGSLVAGCDRHALSPPPALRGEIVGPSANRGHLIRDVAAPPRPTEGDWRTTDVVIVGGGIAGLSAAWRLVDKGRRDFVLLELEAEVGGTSRSGSSTLTPYPWGAHYLPAPNRSNVDLLSLLAQVGAVEGYTTDGEPIFAEHHLCREPQERHFYKGRWHEGLYLHAGATAEDRWQFAQFNAAIAEWARFRDLSGRPAFAIPTSRCSDDASMTELDRLTMNEWLDQRGFSSSRLRWLVDYACRDDYGLRSADTSAWAGLFYFASRAMIAGDTNSVAQKTDAVAATEDVANGRDDSRPLLTWPEGNGRLVAQLRASARAQILADHVVVDVDAGAALNGSSPPLSASTSNVFPACEVIAINAMGKPVGIRARRVIFAAPQLVARHVIRQYRDSPPAFLNEFDYGPWLVANLHLHTRPRDRGFPLAWDNVLYESPGLGYVVATHQRGPEHGPTVLTYYYPFCDVDSRAARELLWQMDWQSCAALCLTDLRMAHADIESLTTRLDVVRWGHAMIRPRPGFVWGARRAAGQPLGPIHFANTDLSGVALFEEAFARGVSAADAVMAAIA